MHTKWVKICYISLKCIELMKKRSNMVTQSLTSSNFNFGNIHLHLFLHRL